MRSFWWFSWRRTWVRWSARKDSSCVCWQTSSDEMGQCDRASLVGELPLAENWVNQQVSGGAVCVRSGQRWLPSFHDADRCVQRCLTSLATPGRWNTNLRQCNPRVTCGRTPLTWDRLVQVFGRPPTHFTSPDWYLTLASTVVEHNINTLSPETHFDDETRKSPLTRPDTHSTTADLLVDPVFSQW